MSHPRALWHVPPIETHGKSEEAVQLLGLAPERVTAIVLSVAVAAVLERAKG